LEQKKQSLAFKISIVLRIKYKFVVELIMR